MTIQTETQAERRRLADLLDDLTTEQWSAPSLCDGWRVREVVAHMTMAFRLKPMAFVGGMARAGFSFNRFADRAARADTAAMTDAELAAALRANIEHPWRPPGGGELGALSHDVIHGLDITEPLGLPAAPTERIALVLDGTGPRQLKYFGTQLDGRQLVATDSEVVVGEGEQRISMATKDILLEITGRRRER